MRSASIVFHRDFKELRQTRAFLIIVIAFAVITITAAMVASFTLKNQEWLRVKAARPLLELIMGLIAYFLPLFILMTFIWAFSSFPIVKEKVNGNIESLLATPLGSKEIWIGKSLAIFIPGFIISTVSTLIVLAAINLIAIKPAAGTFFFPVPMLITAFLVNPLLFFGLLLFIVLFSLANNPDLAIAPSFIVGFGLMMGIPLGVASGKLNLASWSFLLWYTAAALLLWAVVFYSSRLLTKEKIVLSSKGD
ncbi:MAG: ABC transporter permease subunit [Actinomycetota bacterium]|nr:ABC transporter permease subunit [Actinomycetota bacterium]